MRSPFSELFWNIIAWFSTLVAVKFSFETNRNCFQGLAGCANEKYCSWAVPYSVDGLRGAREHGTRAREGTELHPIKIRSHPALSAKSPAAVLLCDQSHREDQGLHWWGIDLLQIPRPNMATKEAAVPPRSRKVSIAEPQKRGLFKQMSRVATIWESSVASSTAYSTFLVTFQAVFNASTVWQWALIYIFDAIYLASIVLR